MSTIPWASNLQPLAAPTHVIKVDPPAGPSRSRTASIREGRLRPLPPGPSRWESSTRDCPASRRGAMARCTAVSHGAWCRSVAHVHSRIHTHTQYYEIGRNGEATHYPGSARKKRAAFPLREGVKMQPRDAPQEAPRKIGQHFPSVTEGTPNNSRPLPGKRPAKKRAAFPLREGVKNPISRHSRGHAAENSAAFPLAQ